MFAPWKKSYDQPKQHTKKQRHHFANKVCIIKAMIFPVVMYRCESWTIKTAESPRTFELWCLRRLLRHPWTARKSNQSTVKKSILNIHWKTDAEAVISILWSPDGKNWLTGKSHSLMLGKTEGRRRRGQQRTRWLDGITYSMVMNLVKGREAWRAAVHRVAKSQTWLSDWTTRNWNLNIYVYTLMRYSHKHSKSILKSYNTSSGNLLTFVQR